MTSLGLESHPLVRWLLDNEIDVRRAVQAFGEGRERGPPRRCWRPALHDLVQYRKNESPSVGLPCVTLRLRMTRHNLTGAPGIRVDCSDDDLDELARWRRAALMRRQIKGAA